MRFALALVSSASALFVASLAGVVHAEECPPGDWFCEPEQKAGPPGPPAPPEPPADEADSKPELRRPSFRRPRWVEPEPPEPPRRRGRHRRPTYAWGFDAHVFGALLGDGRAANQNASMGGLGVGLRYRFTPNFAIQGDLELGFGTDYNGYDRLEAALLAHAIGTLNPRDPVQVYVLGGLGLSSARVTVAPANGAPLWPTYDEHYTYLGADLGAGIEVRVSRRTGVHAELIGFIRERTDTDRHSRPEFVDPETGRTTDTSGGGMLRLGAIFYW